MRLSVFCLASGALAALIGMSLGFVMAASEDFTLAPTHAHLNLLGWVTMALYGLYHRGVDRPDQRLAWTQAGAGAAGFPAMAGGLAGYLTTGGSAWIPVVVIGSVLCMISMALFLTVVLSDASVPRTRAATLRAEA